MIDVQTGSTRQVRRKAKAKGLLIRILRKDYCRSCAEKLHNEGEIDELDSPEKIPNKPEHK
ncbi:MAG: hypothetical protein WA584_20490 [Pyrinomonadaceae bacterium]